MTAISIAPAGPEDAVAMASLLEEMDHFYGDDITESAEERIRQINDALFATPPAAYALLAWDKEQLAGLAAYSFVWPAVGLTRSLYLKELYVAERHRSQGVGQLLMQALFDLAGKCGCSRVEWTTDHSNVGAQAFYSQLGVSAHPSKIFYRVEDTGQGFHLPH